MYPADCTVLLPVQPGACAWGSDQRVWPVAARVFNPVDSVTDPERDRYPDPERSGIVPGTMSNDHTLRVYDSILGLLSSDENPTPLVRLNKVVPFQHAQVFAKLEWYNPFGASSSPQGA